MNISTFIASLITILIGVSIELKIITLDYWYYGLWIILFGLYVMVDSIK